MNRKVIEEMLEVLKDSELYNYDSVDDFIEQAVKGQMLEICKSHAEFSEYHFKMMTFYGDFQTLDDEVLKHYNSKMGDGLTKERARELYIEESHNIGKRIKLSNRLYDISLKYNNEE